ncbi:hypothetical protein [Ktedonobacter sp. SOSP1-52]|uniref:hypothetical protein n=1 Tax=Ktedonobacter sp. SOSP1-52 TaxID=2778366 RepID=UPI001914FC4C|nr:hypothetical protein [Ktedonobacter sp. SOSP1-52]
MSLQLTLRSAHDLSTRKRQTIIDVCTQAYGEDFTTVLAQFPDALHLLAYHFHQLCLLKYITILAAITGSYKPNTAVVQARFTIKLTRTFRYGGPRILLRWQVAQLCLSR